eukprot:tig00020710_g13332.t1
MASAAPGGIQVVKSALQVAIESGAPIETVRDKLDCQLLCVDSDHKARIDFETFRAAVERGDLEIVELLFQQAEICSDGEHVVKYVRVAGHWIQHALNKGREDLAKYLLTWGRDFNFADSKPGTRALVRYLRKGENEKAEKLLALGVTPTLAAVQFEPQDPLLVALEHGCLGAATKILHLRAEQARAKHAPAAAAKAPAEPASALASAPPAPGRERLRRSGGAKDVAAAPTTTTTSSPQPAASAVKEERGKGPAAPAEPELVRRADRALVLRRALQKKMGEAVKFRL